MKPIGHTSGMNSRYCSLDQCTRQERRKFPSLTLKNSSSGDTIWSRPAAAGAVSSGNQSCHQSLFVRPHMRTCGSRDDTTRMDRVSHSLSHRLVIKEECIGYPSIAFGVCPDRNCETESEWAGAPISLWPGTSIPGAKCHLFYIILYARRGSALHRRIF